MFQVRIPFYLAGANTRETVQSVSIQTMHKRYCKCLFLLTSFWIFNCEKMMGCHHFLDCTSKISVSMNTSFLSHLCIYIHPSHSHLIIYNSMGVKGHTGAKFWLHLVFKLFVFMIFNFVARSDNSRNSKR